MKDIILHGQNWSAFARYFQDRAFVENQFQSTIAPRHGGMHPGQREFSLLDNMQPLGAMKAILQQFHEGAALQIDELFRKAVLPETAESGQVSAASLIQTNISDFPDPQVVGRDTQLEKLDEFGADEHARVISIIGAGGVGKTALLDAFTYRLLNRLCPAGSRPDPEVVIYLTAKTEYLKGMAPAPVSLQFWILNTICAAALSTIGENVDEFHSLNEPRRAVLSYAGDMKILFALDNLESLDQVEYEAVATFLAVSHRKQPTQLLRQETCSGYVAALEQVCGSAACQRATDRC